MNGRKHLYDAKPVRVGDCVLRRPISFSEDACVKSAKLLRGTVIYVHPKGRYHTVQFGTGRYAVRESFLGVGLPRRYAGG